ncbi:DUF1850 domain-containing protein [Haloarchaeobius sp. TZWWS8]|uniref:DUF1850 domain-containing protein n=1 Tax=Haloarchaeobius sp. TZWWS8 TaxID=3446121 RepID=UPI003EB951FD
MLLSAAVTAGAVLPGERVLVVENSETGETYVTQPVDGNSTVVLAYNHSVEETPIRDVYHVRNDSLVMTRMEFQSYGWGLPSRNQNVTTEDGWFVLTFDRPYQEISVQPHHDAGHELVVDGHNYDLVTRTDEQSVRIYTRRQSKLTTLLSAL